MMAATTSSPIAISCPVSTSCPVINFAEFGEGDEQVRQALGRDAVHGNGRIVNVDGSTAGAMSIRPTIGASQQPT
jgi:hypothetical protein